MQSVIRQDALRTLVDLRPEPVLERLLRLLQLLGVLEAVQMREHAHHFGEAVRLRRQA